MDIGLLSVLAKRENYTRFKPFIKDYTLSKEGKAVFVGMEVYYRARSAVNEIDWNEFETWFYVYKSGSVTKTNAELFKNFFQQLRDYKPTGTDKDLVAHYVKMAYASTIGEKALAILTKNDGELDDIEELVQDYNKEVGRAINPTDLFASGDVSAVLKRATLPGLNWRLPELNRSCGPLRGGDHVLVTAYVGVGKTTFLADQVSYMASQLPAGKRVVWINNEERSDVVSLRIRTAALGKTVADMAKDSASADTEYLSLMGGDKDKVLVLKNDSTLNNVTNLNALFNECKPGLIVFDVLDKVEGLREKDGKEHERLGRIYKWARSLGHEFDCPVISATQTDVSGADTRYISMDQLRGSKVDKPGEADLLISIGKNKDLTANQETRYLYIAKNKLAGGGIFEEALRHGTFEVKINGPIARYES